MLAFSLLAVGCLSAVVYGLAVLATVIHTHRPAPALPDGPAPPVSLLKPLKGVEEGLEQNLQSVYGQDYSGPIEVVVATTHPDDPALPIARRVAAQFPHVPTRFVQSDPSFGLNPKVANLAGALDAASHDLVLQTDANVRLERDYLRAVVAELLTSDAHLLSSMVVGRGERSLGAALHNVHLSAFTSPGTCFALVFAGIVVVIGKSMLFRRHDLAEVGGLALVRDLLAEDFVIGQAFQRAGKRAVLSTTSVANYNVHAPVSHFLERQARWLKMRAVVHLPGFVVDLLSNPVGFGLLAFLASGLDGTYGAAFIALWLSKAASDAFLVHRTRGEPLSVRHLAVPALRDLLLMALWPYCAVSRTIDWRGTKARLGRDSRLTLLPNAAPALPVVWRSDVKLVPRLAAGLVPGATREVPRHRGAERGDH